jgi:hypothetical protein
MLRGFTAISMLASATGKFNSASNIPNRFELKKNNRNRFQGRTIYSYNTAYQEKAHKNVDSVTPQFENNYPAGRQLNLDSTFFTLLGGKYSEEAKSTYVTKDGEIFITGFNNSYGESNTYGDAQEGYSNTLIAKLDNSGHIMWAKAIGKLGADCGYSVIENGDGEIIVTGRMSAGAGNGDIFVAKLTSNGNVNWIEAIGGIEPDIAYNIQQTYDGGYIIVGFTESYGAGSNDVQVIKLSSEGTVSWMKAIDQSGTDIRYIIKETNYKEFFILGFSTISNSRNSLFLGLSSSGSVTLNKIFSQNMFIAKLDESGNIQNSPTEVNLRNISLTQKSIRPTISSEIATVTSVYPTITNLLNTIPIIDIIDTDNAICGIEIATPTQPTTDSSSVSSTQSTTNYDIDIEIATTTQPTIDSSTMSSTQSTTNSSALSSSQPNQLTSESLGSITLNQGVLADISSGMILASILGWTVNAS